MTCRFPEELCTNLLKNSIPGSTSAVLIGSRARADFHTESDYDIYLRMHWLPAIVFYPKILAQSRKLGNILEAEVHISPLTTGRIRKRKDILLLKTKAEGQILCGEDFRREIRMYSPSELLSEELLLHVFSGGIFLLRGLRLWIQDDFNSLQSCIVFHRLCTKAMRYFVDLEHLLDEPVEPTTLVSPRECMRLSSEKWMSAESGRSPWVHEVADLKAYWMTCRNIFLGLLARICASDLTQQSPSAHDIHRCLNSMNRGWSSRVRVLRFLYALAHRRILAFDLMSNSTVYIVEATILSVLKTPELSDQFSPEEQFKNNISLLPCPLTQGCERPSGNAITRLIDRIETIWPIVSARL